MKNPFDNTDIASYNVKTFGDSVRTRREQLNYSVREMAKKVKMSAIYLSEIERGIRPAPRGIVSGINYEELLVNVLELNDSQKKTFFMMARLSRASKDKTLDGYLIKNPWALKLILKAMEENWNDEQWEKVYNSSKL